MTRQKRKKKRGGLIGPKRDIFTRFKNFIQQEMIILCTRLHTLKKKDTSLRFMGILLFLCSTENV